MHILLHKWIEYKLITIFIPISLIRDRYHNIGRVAFFDFVFSFFSFFDGRKFFECQKAYCVLFRGVTEAFNQDHHRLYQYVWP